MSLVRVLRREPVSLEELSRFLGDERCRLLVYRLKRLISALKRCDRLINPSVEYDVNRGLDEYEVSNILKRYYSWRRHQIGDALNRIVERVLLVADCLSQASPVVLEEAGLTKGLQEAYRAILTLTEKTSESLVSLCDSARYPDEVMKASADLQTSWNTLKTTVRHLIIAPLKASIAEEARKQLIAKIKYGERSPWRRFV
mgnify:CR=1 FL=1